MSEQNQTPEPEALMHAAWLEKSLTIGAAEAAAELRRLHKIEKQRDVLLAALESMLEYTADIDPLQGFEERDSAAVKQAIAAIASVKASCVSQSAAHDTQQGLMQLGDTQDSVKGEVNPRSLLPDERDCCGTFPGTPHRSTCKHYRGVKGGAA